MVRACMFVDRAYGQRLIQPYDGAGLLILGGWRLWGNGRHSRRRTWHSSRVGTPMPLPWDSGKASDIAARWQTLTMDAIRRLGRAAIRVYVDAGAHFTVPPEGAPFVTATFTQGAAGHPVQTFGALVSTVGFGVERTTAKPNFRGFQFWEEDTLQFQRSVAVRISPIPES